MKIQNTNLSRLISLYNKLSSVDFPSAKQAIAHIKDAKRIQLASDDIEELRKIIVNKYKLKEGAINEESPNVRKADEEYIKVLLESTELDLTEFPVGIIEQVRVSPLEIMLLEDLKLYKFESDVVE